MKRNISELEFKVASIKLESKLAKSELKNAKRLEKLRKRQETENKENEQYLEELQ